MAAMGPTCMKAFCTVALFWSAFCCGWLGAWNCGVGDQPFISATDAPCASVGSFASSANAWAAAAA